MQSELTNSMTTMTLSDANLEGEITISPFYFAKAYSNYRIYISMTRYAVSAIIVFLFSGLMAMAGLGAAFLFVPLFYYLGVPLAEATATALLLNVVSLMFAAFNYWRGKLINWQVGLPILITAVILSPIGARLTPFVDKSILLSLFAVFLFFAGFMMLFYKAKAREKNLSRATELAAGATYGKVMMTKTFYGKLAATFYHPQKGAVRYSLVPDFIDAMSKFEFFVYRKKGIEPSQIPLEVRREVIQWVYDQSDEAIFKVEAKPDFKYTPVKGSFNKTKCSACGEYVFDRYVRTKDGQPVCIPCSGYEKIALIER